MSEQPSLGGEFKAWMRQGAKDLHSSIVPAFPDSARSQDEAGTPLNPTSQIVTNQVGGYDAELNTSAARGRSKSEERGMERE